jgi:hypothetical protein
MVEEGENNTDKGEKRLLSPATWVMNASLIMAIVIVPIAVAVFYMFKISYKLFELPSQYSVLMGLGVGITLSIIGGVIYSNFARKHVE